jgi:hypothetical protein
MWAYCYINGNEIETMPVSSSIKLSDNILQQWICGNAVGNDRHVVVALSCYLRPLCARQYSLYLPVVSVAAYEPQNYDRSPLDWLSKRIMFLWHESLMVQRVKCYSTSSVVEVLLRFLISLQYMAYRQIYVVNLVDF